MPDDELIQVALDDDERRLLLLGLVQWGGPAHPTEELAVAMGFAGLDAFREDQVRLRRELKGGAALSRQDWQRVLVATEVVFVSDVFGAGLDWSIVTGISDVEAIALLRALQRKLPRWRSTAQFHVADGEVTIADRSRG